jgi:hypothetical protein
MTDKRLRQFGAGIAAVGEDMTQPGKAETKGLDDLGSAVPILDIGGMDQHEEQETQRVGDDVTLAALDLLACIITGNSAAFGRLEALAVDDARSRATSGAERNSVTSTNLAIRRNRVGRYGGLFFPVLADKFPCSRDLIPC